MKKNYFKLGLLILSMMLSSTSCGTKTTNENVEHTSTEAMFEYKTDNMKLAEVITEENLKLEDEELLRNAKSDLENALKENSASSNFIQDEITRIKALLKVIEQVNLATKRISILNVDMNIGDEDDVRNIELAQMAYNALSEYGKELVSLELRNLLDVLSNALVDYQIISIKCYDGLQDINESNWILGNATYMILEMNGLTSRVIGVEINDELLDENFYFLEEEGTIISIRSLYLDTLPVGEYKLKILYKDGETSTLFNVQEETEPIQSFEGYYQYSELGKKIYGIKLENIYRIPQNKLKAMTVEQLAQAVIDYPFLSSTVTTYPYLDGYSKGLASVCDAYKEILTREFAKEALIEKLKSLDTENNIKEEILFDCLKKAMRDEERFIDTFTDEEKVLLGVR